MSHCYIAYLPDQGIDQNHLVVKVGFSNNPAYRFQELCSMAWIGPAWIEATIGKVSQNGPAMERFMHKILRRERIHGEWFHLTWEKLRSAMEEMCNEFGEDFEVADVSDEDSFNRYISRFPTEYPQEQAA